MHIIQNIKEDKNLGGKLTLRNVINKKECIK